MNEHDATEVAYKNGYKAGYQAGVKELAKRLKKEIRWLGKRVAAVYGYKIDDVEKELAGDPDEG